jgi:hypothetical protein
MAVICEKTDVVFPMTAEIFYPNVEQGAYGNVKKQWIHNKTIACYFASFARPAQEDIVPNISITRDLVLVGRVRSDIRISAQETGQSFTNIVVSNIKDNLGNSLYMETSGVRANKATIFEIASQEPIIGPFGNVEYYKVVIRRSENQAVEV